MKKESRTIIFDKELNIEAYTFKGVMQKFPNHFHKHYVIGFIEKGQNRLSFRMKTVPDSFLFIRKRIKKMPMSLSSLQLPIR